MVTPPRPLPLALSMGEPAGVGGEIALKAWMEGAVPPFFVIDAPERLKTLAGRLGMAVPVEAIEAPEEALGVYGRALPVLPIGIPTDPVPGRPDPANAGAVIEAIEKAVALVREGRAGAVVTNPIQKQSLYEAGFAFPGHTEFLAHLAGGGMLPVMMLACPLLKVVPVTIHVSLREAIAALTTEGIVEAARITAGALKNDFGIARPRLAVAGLNPHAGEGGGMGREDIDIVAPAIGILRKEGIDAFGPAPSDTLFTEPARTAYDAAICMYHDQALIPIKTIDFEGGVNVTLGLPFVRTSPDHGTALDIAGTGQAGADSLTAALNMAGDMVSRRG